MLIEHSPLMSWVYDVFSANTVARGLGTLEIVAAILIVTRPVSARLSAIGSALAIVLFCGTLSFLFTTPSVVSRFAGPVPVLSALPGQFPAQRCCAAWCCGVDSRRGGAGAPRVVSF